MPNGSPTGSINWSRIDPKTWLLTNTRQVAPPPSPISTALGFQTAAPPPASPDPKQLGDLGNLSVGEVGGAPPTLDPQQQRGLLNDLTGMLRRNERRGGDLATYFPILDQLINSGAVYAFDPQTGEPGSGTIFPLRGGQKATDRFVRLVDAWRDSMQGAPPPALAPR